MMVLAIDLNATACGQVLGQLVYGVRNFLNILHIIGPILLILALVIAFGRGVLNPDAYKKGTPAFLNSIIAAIVLFLLPYLLDAVMALFGESFRLSDCWNQVKNIKTTTDNGYVITDEDTKRESTINGNSESEKAKNEFKARQADRT